jgi:multiple sugar transport system permease protein
MSKSVSKRNGNHTLPHVALIGASILMLFPFAWQLIMSLSTNAQITSIPPTFWPGDLQFENYISALTAIPFLSQLKVSVVVTIARVLGQVVLCSLAGYAFARMEFRFKRTIFALILSILMVPHQVFLLPQYKIVQALGWLDTLPGIIAPGLFSAFGIFLMRQFFMGLPKELEEAARLDGAGPLRIFAKVMLPLSIPAISALVVLVTLSAWNDLLWPLVVTSTPENMPLSVGLANMQGLNFTDYGPLMAASIMAMAPILILFIALQKRVIDGLAHSGMK